MQIKLKLSSRGDACAPQLFRSHILLDCFYATAWEEVRVFPVQANLRMLPDNLFQGALYGEVLVEQRIAHRILVYPLKGLLALVALILLVLWSTFDALDAEEVVARRVLLTVVVAAALRLAFFV